MVGLGGLRAGSTWGRSAARTTLVAMISLRHASTTAALLRGAVHPLLLGPEPHVKGD